MERSANGAEGGLVPLQVCFVLFCFKILFIYLSGGGNTDGEGEADSLLSREPDMGLDSRTPRS